MASNQLSKNIARCRKQIGMTQEDLGQALFVSGQAVSRWERGGTPDAELLPKIADALGVSLDVLFGRGRSLSPGRPSPAGSAAAPRTRSCCRRSQTHSASRSMCSLAARPTGNPMPKLR